MNYSSHKCDARLLQCEILVNSVCPESNLLRKFKHRVDASHRRETGASNLINVNPTLLLWRALVWASSAFSPGAWHNYCMFEWENILLLIINLGGVCCNFSTHSRPLWGREALRQQFALLKFTTRLCLGRQGVQAAQNLTTNNMYHCLAFIITH